MYFNTTVVLFIWQQGISVVDLNIPPLNYIVVHCHKAVIEIDVNDDRHVSHKAMT